MNWSEIESRWEWMIPLLRTYWPKLGAEDFARIDRRRGALAEVLQERYGWSEEESEARICTFEEDVRLPGAVK